MPRRPLNGARTTLRSTCALRPAVSVCAVLSCASTSSSCACEMTFPCASTADRFAVRSARSRRASADASWARSTPASSSTSTWPSRAMLPDSKRILLTMPGTSLLTFTLLRLETLPTADSVVSQVSPCAAVVPTGSGGGPIFCICLPIPMSMPICAPLIPTSRRTSSKRPPATMRTRNNRRCLPISLIPSAAAWSERAQGRPGPRRGKGVIPTFAQI